MSIRDSPAWASAGPSVCVAATLAGGGLAILAALAP